MYNREAHRREQQKEEEEERMRNREEEIKSRKNRPGLTEASSSKEDTKVETRMSVPSTLHVLASSYEKLEVSATREHESDIVNVVTTERMHPSMSIAHGGKL